MDPGGRGRSRGMLPLLALHAANEFYRLQRKPPVTAALVVANTLVYLRPTVFDSIIPPIDEVWFNPYLIVKYMDAKRLLLSPFYHIGESHLVYNMMSLLWKGIQLETLMGSVDFASMIATLLGMSQGITLLLAKSLVYVGYGRPYYSEYAVGFSGVLFAMKVLASIGSKYFVRKVTTRYREIIQDYHPISQQKVVLNSESDNYTSVYGLMVPSRHAAWVELILIQMFVPGVSFLGHLGGILAGLLYLKLRASHSGSNPLAMVIKGVSSVLTWPFRGMWWRPQIQGRGTVGTSRRWDQHRGGLWRCRACTYDNAGLSSICEMCGTSEGHVNARVPYQMMPNELTVEELRRRRVERYIR